VSCIKYNIEDAELKNKLIINPSVISYLKKSDIVIRFFPLILKGIDFKKIPKSDYKAIDEETQLKTQSE